ncbi:MAG: hypothetical protein ACRC57_04700 [Sarcina sp.]
MSIQPGDFTMFLSFQSTSTNIQAVVGRTVSLKILFNNYSLTDNLYNLGLTIELPDGVSFVSSSATASSNIINSSFQNIINFINIKDLYHNEVNYAIDVTLQLDSHLRSNPQIPNSLNSTISGIRFSATADTMPRGYIDSGNSSVSSQIIQMIKSQAYSLSFIGPQTYLKGAGSISSSATSPFTYSLVITNNTLESSLINLNIELANGLRYLGNYETSGTDAILFASPIITNVGAQNFVSLSFNNISLSTSSITTINFDCAIWDKLTQNGILNSGAEISQNEILTSLATANSLSFSYSSSLSTSATLLKVTKTLDIIYTDWYFVNNFTIYYELSSYINLNDIIMIDTIPDGMLFTQSSLTPTSVISNTDGTTSVSWNIGNLFASTNGTITFSTTTQNAYINASPIYSGDVFIDSLVYGFQNPYTLSSITETINNTLYVNTPVITKTTIDYYYEDLTSKSYNVATQNDFVEFTVTYDASKVLATQHNVNFYDYPPLNMILQDVPTYITSGSFPSSVITSLISDNGFIIELGDLIGGTYFEITFKIQVTKQTSSSTLLNLGKININNSNNNSISCSSSSTINFGIPNLIFSSYIDNSTCLSLSNSYTYNLTIQNLASKNTDYICDGFNLQYQIAIPSILSINFANISGTGSYKPLVSSNNIITIDITKLLISQSITLTLDFTVTQTPIASSSYLLNSSCTLGTIQQSSTSDLYTNSPAVFSTQLYSCPVTINKSFSLSQVNLNQNYIVTNIITIPVGTKLYNLSLNDELISTNINSISLVSINNNIASYTIENSSIIITIDSLCDASLSQITYIITYTTNITQIAAINFEQNFITNSLASWQDISSNDFSISTNALLKVIVPFLTIQKYQRNYTKNQNFTQSDIMAHIGDYIFYKLQITNTGKAPAYIISISDILNSNLEFISLLVGSGSFNSTTNTLTITSDNLSAGYYTEFLLETRAINSSNNIITTNIATANYKTDISESSYYDTQNSNSLSVLTNILKIEKSQRNSSTDELFTPDTISVIKGQTFQFKISITNTSSVVITNLTIKDNFPLISTFLNFEDFNYGTTNVISNLVIATITQLLPNQTIELIYNLELSVDILEKIATSFNINFNLPSSSILFNLNSNTIYTDLSSLGKGFAIY